MFGKCLNLWPTSYR